MMLTAPYIILTAGLCASVTPEFQVIPIKTVLTIQFMNDSKPRNGLLCSQNTISMDKIAHGTSKIIRNSVIVFFENFVVIYNIFKYFYVYRHI